MPTALHCGNPRFTGAGSALTRKRLHRTVVVHSLEATNTEQFCTSCHEMRDNVFAELKGTIHYSNRSGVRATCPDCHVPHQWTDKIARKMQASKEVWGKIFGTIDTREKFLEHRLELAKHEWARLKANDSLECRNCHAYRFMDWTRQSRRAVYVHSTALAGNEHTCIDCHKGIAHRLPNMEGIEMLFGAPASRSARRSEWAVRRVREESPSVSRFVLEP